MNWELQLAIGLEGRAESLVEDARRARELCAEGKYGRALEFLWRHYRPVRRAGSPRFEVFLLIHMGQVYRHWLFDVASRFFRDALELSRRAGFARGEMVAACSLAELHRDRREDGRAVEWYERGLALAEDCAGPVFRRDLIAEMLDCMLSDGVDGRSCDLIGKLAALEAEIEAEVRETSPDRRAGTRGLAQNNGRRA